jgi:DNA (cytosine-5)-methyltransferase 1
LYGKVYLLSLFGLPQIRERAIIVAAKREYDLHTLDELWAGYRVAEVALTVQRAFSVVDARDPAQKLFPQFASQEVRERMHSIPVDGGSWLDLAKNARTRHLLTNAMQRNWSTGRVGSYPDVYGRMWWNRPAPTIKRECAHCGNGRYAHPVEDRLCSVREMATLQGFPQEFRFEDSALSNLYRHIGDAVPPLVSHQLAWVCNWMLTGEKPSIRQTILPNTHLRRDEDIEEDYAILLESGTGTGA